jgi:succinate dehydrogenase iron-sulfur subunit
MASREADREMLEVEVWRGTDTGRFQTFAVPRREHQTVLDVVTEIQREQDATLAYRFACRVGMCGSCAMVVNGRPRWTCRTRVSQVAAGNRLRLEPLRNLTVVKDLAVEMTEFFDKWRDAGGSFVSGRTRRDRPPTPASNASAAACATRPATWWVGNPPISARRRSTAPGPW